MVNSLNKEKMIKLEVVTYVERQREIAVIGVIREHDEYVAFFDFS